MKLRSFLFAVLLPPVYLFCRGKIFSGIFSLLFWLLAWGMLLSIIAALFSPIPYLLSFLPAAFALRRQQVDAVADVMARKMAAAMQAQSQPG